MKTKNSTLLIGYVGNEPVIRNCKNGNKMAFLRLATDERTRSKEEGKENTYRATWHDIAVWGEHRVGRLGNITKGSHIMVEGKLEYQSYTDKNGTRRRCVEINAYHITDMDR